ncbi:MAG TPA: hypothetical protein VNL70_08085 [Tepidisphaeraceae bacterium]|nr:hypothetical protein [Tepidisphaeraceae bacterium]
MLQFLMPTIPLYNPAAAPHAWHDVRCPGGYESWHFDADDAANDRQIIVGFFDGMPLHPKYRRACVRYLRRPTRIPPPLPGDYRFVGIWVCQHGRIVCQSLRHFPHSQFAADSTGIQVCIGPNSIQQVADTIRLTVSDAQIQAELQFVPRIRVRPLELSVGSPEHRWVIVAPLCDVRGTVRCGGRDIDFSGTGYHDHRYATAPINAAARRILRGRATFDDATIAFDLGDADDVRVIRADAAGAAEVSASAALEVQQHRRTWLGHRYPARLRSRGGLELSNPRLIDMSWRQLRLVYEAAMPDRRGGRAICQVLYPGRLRRPFAAIWW